MGFGVVAGSLIIFAAVTTAGTLLAGSMSDLLGDGAVASNEALQRTQRSSNEAFANTLSAYSAAQDRVRTNWRNDGSDEIDLDKVTVLVEGVVTDHAALARFQVTGFVNSGIWMPEEILEVWVEGQGNVDVGIVGPYGTALFRRP